MGERRDRYMRIIADTHEEWALANTAERFAPDEHPDGSDYNVEVLDVEATGAQLDQLDAMIVEAVTAAGLVGLHPPRINP